MFLQNTPENRARMAIGLGQCELWESRLGHNSKAVHRAYAKRALGKIPSLEEYEKRNEPHAVPAA